LPKIICKFDTSKTSHNFTKIVFKPLQTNLFNIVLLSFFLSIGCGTLYAQEIFPKPQTGLTWTPSKLRRI
jgi:hypothetical protein